MNNEYIGVLQTNDPLYGFLCNEVLGQVLGFNSCDPVFDVYRLDKDSCNWSVFHYADRRTSVNLVGKFYGNKWLYTGEFGNLDLRSRLMRREFDNLLRIRALGLDTPLHQVVRPLATNEAINCVLVEEFASGPDLNFYIWKALQHNRGRDLFLDRLTDVARFLVELHNRSQTSQLVQQTPALAYLDKIIGQLAHQQIISPDQHQRLVHFCDCWATSQVLNTGQQVLIHGDVRPVHFVFGNEQGVTAVDLENLRTGDRAVDLGRLAAELKHLFFWHTGNLWASEPYIQHLYASYASCLPVGVEDFVTLTTRGRFYMGCFQARIARNPWHDLNYRHQLMDDAEVCLNI